MYAFHCKMSDISPLGWQHYDDMQSSSQCSGFTFSLMLSCQGHQVKDSIIHRPDSFPVLFSSSLLISLTLKEHHCCICNLMTTVIHHIPYARIQRCLIKTRVYKFRIFNCKNLNHVMHYMHDVITSACGQYSTKHLTYLKKNINRCVQNRICDE